MRLQTFSGSFFKLILFAIVAVFSLNVSAQIGKTVESNNDAYYRKLAEANTAIEKSPADAEVYYVRGSLYVSGKEYEAAMTDYDQAISLDPKFYKAYSGRGYIYLQYKLYVEAIKEFKRAQELNPKDSYAAENLAYIEQRISISNLSLEEYANLIKTDPTNHRYYLYRARLHIKEKNYIAAIEDSTKAIELNPNYKDAYRTRSFGYCETGKWKESTADISQFDQAQGTSNGVVCHIKLEKIKYCAENDDCKIAFYSAGIDNPRLIISPPGLGDFYAGRGLLYYESGKFDLAHSDFENADKYSYTIKDERLGLYLGNLLLKKGKYDQALKKFTEAMPGSSEAYAGIGEIYLIKREYEKALEYFDRALFLNPRLAKAYLGRGVVHYEIGRNYGDFENNQVKAVESYKKAVKDFENVIEINLLEAPSEVYIKRAKVYEKLGEQAKADLDRAKYQELAEKP